MGRINKEIIRVAVVGAGRLAKSTHYPCLALIKGVEIAGICEINTEALQATADRYDIKNRYTDYQKMIEEVKPDAVYVLGQPHIMYDIWIWCLNRGMNLFVEKPLGINLHQAQNLAHLAQEKGCITQVDFQRRSSPLFVEMLRKCREKGPILHGVCMFNKRFEGPYLKSLDEIYETTCHAIDVLRAICGGEIVKIDSVTKRVRVHNINLILAMFHFDNGATGILTNNHVSGRRTFSFEIHAPDICAVAELEVKGHLYTTSQKPDGNGEEYDAQVVAGSKERIVSWGYLAKHQEFINCVRSGDQPSSHFGDALKTMEAGEIILSQGLLKGPAEFSKVVKA